MFDLCFLLLSMQTERPQIIIIFPFYTAENSQQRRLEVLYLITKK